MREINLHVQGVDMDFKKANTLARSVAAFFEKEPAMVAWNDAIRHQMSPVIEGATRNRWRDYGEAYGGKLNVSVNDDFDFIFADSSEYEGLEHSPYVAVRDKMGHEYLCLAESLRDPNNPQEDACFRIDEAEHSALHEG